MVNIFLHILLKKTSGLNVDNFRFLGTTDIIGFGLFTPSKSESKHCFWHSFSCHGHLGIVYIICQDYAIWHKIFQTRGPK